MSCCVTPVCTPGKPFPIAAWLHTRAAQKKVDDALQGAAPVAEWLDAHVGPTTILPEDWRRKSQ